MRNSFIIVFLLYTGFASAEYYNPGYQPYGNNFWPNSNYMNSGYPGYGNYGSPYFRDPNMQLLYMLLGKANQPMYKPQTSSSSSSSYVSRGAESASSNLQSMSNSLAKNTQSFSENIKPVPSIDFTGPLMAALSSLSYKPWRDPLAGLSNDIKLMTDNRPDSHADVMRNMGLLTNNTSQPRQYSLLAGSPPSRGFASSITQEDAPMHKNIHQPDERNHNSRRPINFN